MFSPVVYENSLPDGIGVLSSASWGMVGSKPKRSLFAPKDLFYTQGFKPRTTITWKHGDAVNASTTSPQWPHHWEHVCAPCLRLHPHLPKGEVLPLRPRPGVHQRRLCCVHPGELRPSLLAACDFFLSALFCALLAIGIDIIAYYPLRQRSAPNLVFLLASFGVCLFSSRTSSR